MKLSAVVLTKNEEKNIEKCLKSIDFCDEIIVVDDYSTDKTLEEIQKLEVKSQNYKSKVKIFKKQLNKDFAFQRNYGLSKATNEWILFIDADEEISENLKLEIKNLKVKKNSGTWMGTVHEVFHTANKVGQINGFLNHYPHPTLKEFINDINYYSFIRTEELFSRGTKTNIFEIIFFPFGKFIYNYFLNLGFLDGPAGFTYAFMMSFHSFLVRAKFYQLTNKQ
ncbi:MAG: Lipopolysaccharide biosynthesis glycosyltransferase [Candidatus Roizmanbacteria bacterium GW2011_GWA2_34_18]|uniref:Lipopolysaccharide biosynthesis glycosyltransferase n=1 Tax=Candidatus Roizmanbacteria bacterium GW2011_GWA2_34_18 TaxID=1618477 RepID=A0A0G0D7V4_9BACT|nr:MAG: Lipopolysaccharide biosynthesis glycosyltransferase [Candidatus Roizmanbacteria bacterium GW2011_GWA2_34_18]